MILDSIFQKDFAGDLKPYIHLKQHLNEIVKEFDE
jgi:hypothetical protein